MIKQALTYFFVLGIATSSVNPAIAAQKKKIKQKVSLKKSTLSQSIMMSTKMKTSARKNKGRNIRPIMLTHPQGLNLALLNIISPRLHNLLSRTPFLRFIVGFTNFITRFMR